MITLIARAHNLKVGGVGALLGVNQSTVSRWFHKGEITDAHLAKLVATFHDACLIVRRDYPIPAALTYVCSFAPNYGDGLTTEANTALSRCSFAEALQCTVPRGAVHVDIHIRATQLRRGARAHCFVDSPLRPCAFVILVSDALTPYEQHVVAFDEAYAHIMKKLIHRQEKSQHTPFF
jgi:hypothetical protein